MTEMILTNALLVLPDGVVAGALILANCTKRNGKSPWPHFSRQSLISRGKRMAYSRPRE